MLSYNGRGQRPEAMDNRQRRGSQVAPDDDNDKNCGDETEYISYKRQTRGEYEYLMKEFEFRCRRAAMMNYFEASLYEKYIYRLEIVAKCLGTISLPTVGAWFMPKTSLSHESMRQMSTMGVVGLVGAGLLYFISKGSSRMIPSLTRRAELNIETGAAWKRLAKTTKSFRIRLDNPKLDVPDYANWYEQLLREQEKLCVKVIIPQATYKMFNNPELVYSDMRQRRQMFLEYLQLESSDLEILQSSNTAKGMRL